MKAWVKAWELGWAPAPAAAEWVVAVEVVVVAAVEVVAAVAAVAAGRRLPGRLEPASVWVPQWEKGYAQ